MPRKDVVFLPAVYDSLQPHAESLLSDTLVIKYVRFCAVSSAFGLKVVGNEKEGGPGKWQIIDIGLGLW